MDSTNNIANYIFEHTKQRDSRAVVVVGQAEEQYCHYPQLWAQVDAYMIALQQLGLVPGERVACFMHNHVDALAMLLALLRSQLTAVMIDPDLPASERDAMLAMADVAVAVLDSETPIEVAASIAVVICFQGDRCRIVRHSITVSETVYQDCDATIAMMLFTSGSSGNSKAVMLTHDNFLYVVTSHVAAMPVDSTDVVMSVLPIFHVASVVTSVFVPLAAGACIVYLRDLSPQRMHFCFCQYQPTMLCAVPRLYQMVYDKVAQQLQSGSIFRRATVFALLRVCLLLRRRCRVNLGVKFFKSIVQRFGRDDIVLMSGSAALPVDVYDFFYAMGMDIREAYGMTETTGPVSIALGGNDYAPGSSGAAISQSTYCCIDDQIVYCGPAMMRGYFRLPDQTRQLLRTEGLFTGDLGCLSRGALYVQGRKNTLIILSDGKKAMPSAIEYCYRDITGVADLAVTTRETNQRIELVLLVVLEHPADAVDVRKRVFVRANELKSPFRIHALEVVSDIARTNTLKVKRHMLHKHVTAAPVDLFARLLLDKAMQQQHFSELGIDSLKAYELTQQINEHYSVSLPPSIFWQYNNFSEIQSMIDSPTQMASPSPLVQHAADHDDAIVVVAMSGRFPGHANSVKAFWCNQERAVDAIVDVPAERWDIDAFYDEDRLAPGKICSRKAGVIDDLYAFDAQAFGLKPRRAQMIDPQQQLVLTEVRKLIAQLPGGESRYRGSSTGVFVGASANDFLMQTAKSISLSKINPYLCGGLTNSAIAGRVAYSFDLQGPVMIVDTACSSALVALHQACNAIKLGDCDCAVVAAVNVLLDPMLSVAFSKAGMLAPDGRCKTFDNQADGYVRSEGVAAVMLKKRQAALDDGDTILAQVVATSMNHDGLSNGFSAPSGAAQVRCLQQALDRSGLRPDQVGFIESHGTGTPLGDPVELSAIHSVYGNRRTPLYIGALKSMIGHGEAVSGLSSLIKSILVLQHQRVPANLHFSQLNEAVEIAEQLRFPSTLTDIRCDYAAVSAYGFSGTNTHMIIGRP